MDASSNNPQPLALADRYPQVWADFSDALRPPPDLTPDEFARQHRKLHSTYCVQNPGDWISLAYQPDVMNAVQEAIRSGKRGVVFMKAGQIGGSDCMINAFFWCKVMYPGPQLFLTSTDDVAEEFGRDRFDKIIADMEPVRKRLLPGERGQILKKRFVDGKIAICGGQSINKLQSEPYRFVLFDELDSLTANLDGGGDPIKLGENRTTSFKGEKLLMAYAHPTTKESGAGKIYYEFSDQRRGHIQHSCGKWFWIDWFNPEIVKIVPREGQTPEQAERDADCYELHCPNCKARIDEAERVAMLRAGVRQISILPPEEADKKSWIGLHAGKILLEHISLRSIAQEWIETDCGRDENTAKVFVNKTLGDVREPKVKGVQGDSLRKLIVVKRRENDPEFYSRGQVPPWVLFLTGGQDSRESQLHATIWGWGVRETVDHVRYLCGALIDYVEIERQRDLATGKYPDTFTDAEYHIFDDFLYNRRFPCTLAGEAPYMVRAAGHDIGFPPTQIPVIRYCRSWPERAIPCKGASEDHSSASTAPPVYRGTAKRHKAGDAEFFDDPQMVINTYLLKVDFYGWVEKRIVIPDLRDGRRIGEREVSRIVLPENVGQLWLTHTQNERLAAGKKPGELVWKAKGPNHLADCNIYAYGAALDLDPHARNQTAEEHRQRRAARPIPRARPGGDHHDPSLG